MRDISWYDFIMAEERLKRKFFSQPTIKVAKGLLGKYLVRRVGKKQLVGKIVETEAYIGPNDKASHASFGKTERCKLMYGLPGIAYVYLIYGMYWMLNIVTEEKGKPCAILIRAVQPQLEIKKLDIEELKKLGAGPGKLCRWLKINKSFNGEDLTKSKRLLVIDSGERIKERQIIKKTRVGVNYAGEWAKKPWRFYIKNNPFVSKK